MKSASKIGSSTSFKDACTIRSAVVGIPSVRTLPFALGIDFARTTCGLNVPVRICSRSRAKPISTRSPGTSRGARPSIPAVRAPLLSRTRVQAATKNAGSWTRLNTSSKRRPGSDLAQRCNRVCIVSTRAHAREGSGHGASVFTGASPFVLVRLLITLDPFAMWTAFPSSDYYGSSAPPRPARQTMYPAGSPTTGRGMFPAGPGRFLRSLRNPSTGSAPSYAPAPSPRLRRSPSPWPPDRRHHPAQEFPDVAAEAPTRVRSATRPIPARLGVGGLVLWGFQPLVPCVCLSVSLAGPAPSGSAGTSRRCRGLLRHRAPCRARRPSSSFLNLLRQAKSGALSSPQGSAAPRSARCRQPTAGWAHRR